MTKKRLIITACAALAAALAATLAWWLWVYRPGQEVHIAEKIHLLKKTAMPMRLKIVTRSNGMAKVAVKFFDLDNNNVGRCEQDYAGGNITLKITDVDISGRHIYFPSEMVQYSHDDTISMPLEQYYAKDGFPMTYSSPNADPLLNYEIGRLYSRIQSGGTAEAERRYGCTVTQSQVTLNYPAELVNYTLATSASGTLRISN